MILNDLFFININPRTVVVFEIFVKTKKKKKKVKLSLLHLRYTSRVSILRVSIAVSIANIDTIRFKRTTIASHGYKFFIVEKFQAIIFS